MKNTALIRSIPFWLLLVLSLASIGVGTWFSTEQIGTMTAALLDGTATGVEVYAGQSWVVVGAALIAGGVIGLFLALAIAAAKALIPRPAVEVVEAIDWNAEQTDGGTAADAETENSEDEGGAPDEAGVSVPGSAEEDAPLETATSR